jgi:hypothetical protein
MLTQSSAAVGERIWRTAGLILLGFGLAGSALTLFSAIDALYPVAGSISSLIAAWRTLTSSLWNSVFGVASIKLPPHYVAVTNFIVFMGSIAFRGWRFWPPASGPRPTPASALVRTLAGAALLTGVWAGYLSLWQSGVFAPVAKIFADAWAARQLVTYWGLAAIVYVAFVTPIGLAAAAPFLRRAGDAPAAVVAGGAYTVMLTCIFALPTVQSGPVSPWSDPAYAGLLAVTYLIGLPVLFLTSAVPGAARQLLFILSGVALLWVMNSLSVLAGDMGR